MKYTLVRRVKFTHANDCVSVVKEADSIEQVLKYKVGAEMLEEKGSKVEFEVHININDVFNYINSKEEKPVLLTDELPETQAS